MEDFKLKVHTLSAKRKNSAKTIHYHNVLNLELHRYYRYLQYRPFIEYRYRLLKKMKHSNRYCRYFSNKCLEKLGSYIKKIVLHFTYWYELDNKVMQYEAVLFSNLCLLAII